MISWLLSDPLKEAATMSDVDLVFSSVSHMWSFSGGSRI